MAIIQHNFITHRFRGLQQEIKFRQANLFQKKSQKSGAVLQGCAGYTGLLDH